MTALTESKHAGCFMSSEADGTLSRETATVLSGQLLVAGEVVKLSGTKLVTRGASGTAVGIIFDNVDATAGDVANCVYIARLAEVKLDALTYTDDTDDTVLAGLATLHIRAR